jgi:hypothetical protein
MRRHLALACLACLSLAACRKEAADESGGVRAAAPAKPAATAAVPPLVLPGTLAVAQMQLGTAVDGARQVTAPAEAFSPTDTIIVAIVMRNANAAPVNGKLTARWTGPDGQVFNEESQQRDFDAGDTINFRVAEPKGFAPGAYRLEVSLDGKPVEARSFTVK